MPRIDFPARLRHMRQQAKLSQRELSVKLGELGYPTPRPWIAQWETYDGHGKGCRIRADRLLPIAKACGFTWEDWVKEGETR